MLVNWTDESVHELSTIAEYIALENPKAAFTLVERIILAVENQLPANPNIGRPGRVAGTRELIVHKSYIAVYSFESDTVTILTVRHVARLWPDSFK